jgi:tetratricopeptide (TPR) repeat protein
MPIASPEVYAEMLDRAKAGKFAYPAINCTSSQTIVAAIRGFAEAESDGIVQFSWGGAEFASGQAVKSMVAGAVALAEFAHSIAAHYDVNIALHTDHCPKDKLPGFMEPLLKVSQERVAKGLEPLFQSHMWDGSAVPLAENMEISKRLLEENARVADSYYGKARKFMREGDFHNAIQYGKLAISYAPEDARYYSLLAECHVRNPEARWQRAAEQNFLRAAELDPWNADYKLSLGRFYKKRGLKLRARKQFEAALTVVPGLEDAIRELEALR